MLTVWTGPRRLADWSWSKSKWNYFTTDGQSVSMSWYLAPLWDLLPDITSCLKFAVLILWGALSDERAGLSISRLLYDWQLASQYVLVSNTLVGLANRYYFLTEGCSLVSVRRPLWREDMSAIYSVVTEWSESRRTRNHTSLSHLRVPQPGGLGSHIYIPQEEAGPVIPPGTGFPLRLSGLRWRYSKPPRIYEYMLEEQDGPVQSQSHVKTDGQPISTSWCLVHWVRSCT
jgi:hypothetical protein